MKHIPLPLEVLEFWEAHCRLKRYFSRSGLSFTLDGKLLGDLAEALVADAFGLVLCKKRTKAVDAHTLDGQSVQIKATARLKVGPAYTPGQGAADRLIFVRFDFEAGHAEVLYNGPEAPIRALLPQPHLKIHNPGLAKVLAENAKVAEVERLRAATR